VPMFDPLLVGEEYFPGTCPLIVLTPGGLADEDDLVDGTANYVHFDEGMTSRGIALRTS